MNTTTRLNEIAIALGVPVERFYSEDKRDCIALILSLCQASIAQELGVDKDKIEVAWKYKVAERFRKRRGPAIHDQTYSHEDGKGRIINIIGNIVQIYFGSNEEAAAKEVGILELFWNDQFKRWEYGDRERK